MILYAEDNRLNQMLFQAYLEERPEFPVVIADTVDAAIAEAQRARPLIAFIDLDLNGRPGVDVLVALKAMDKADQQPIWCVALTANSGPLCAEQALAQGFDDFWTKPIELADTLTKIDALVSRLRTPRPAA
ncbi:MAG: response regulator [Aeromicrobium sp.]|nr:response regulator [Burkholderiales bacterium]